MTHFCRFRRGGRGFHSGSASLFQFPMCRVAVGAGSGRGRPRPRPRPRRRASPVPVEAGRHSPTLTFCPAPVLCYETDRRALAAAAAAAAAAVRCAGYRHSREGCNIGTHQGHVTRRPTRSRVCRHFGLATARRRRQKTERSLASGDALRYCEGDDGILPLART